ncbi:MAG: ABC transporter substrate-binding protein [Kineosporiaceae bacterium]
MTRSDSPRNVSRRNVSRRSVLRGAGAAALAAGGVPLAGCGRPSDATLAGDADARPIRIGYVSPQTGPIQPFAAADQVVIDSVRARLAQGLPTRAGLSMVEVIVRDSGSDPARADAVARELVTAERVDIMLAASTPATTNPVSDVCEEAGVPCITTLTPWDSWFFGRGASSATDFRWTYHFYWGSSDVHSVFLDMWDTIPTNRIVAALWGDDTDGRSWGDPVAGFSVAAAERGYEVVDPGLYASGTADFSAIIDRFIDARAEVLVGIPTPPEFTAFWQQAAARGFRPRVATIARALLFPSVVAGLGPAGEGLALGAGWTPTYPYSSSLTQQSAASLAQEFTDLTGEPWIQPLGFVHALFEVAAAAIAGAENPDDREGIADQLSRLEVDTVVGPVSWAAREVRTIATTPLVGGQWRLVDGRPEVAVVSNAQALSVPVEDSLQELPR